MLSWQILTKQTAPIVHYWWKNSLIISGTVHCDSKWDKVKTTRQQKNSSVDLRPYVFSNFHKLCASTLYFYFWRFWYPRVVAMASARKNSRLSKTTYQQPTGEEMPTVSQQLKDLMHQSFFILKQFLIPFEKTQRKIETLNIYTKYTKVLWDNNHRKDEKIIYA